MQVLGRLHLLILTLVRKELRSQGDVMLHAGRSVHCYGSLATSVAKAAKSNDVRSGLAQISNDAASQFCLQMSSCSALAPCSCNVVSTNRTRALKRSLRVFFSSASWHLSFFNDFSKHAGPQQTRRMHAERLLQLCQPLLEPWDCVPHALDAGRGLACLLRAPATLTAPCASTSCLPTFSQARIPNSN